MALGRRRVPLLPLGVDNRKPLPCLLPQRATAIWPGRVNPRFPHPRVLVPLPHVPGEPPGEGLVVEVDGPFATHADFFADEMAGGAKLAALLREWRGKEALGTLRADGLGQLLVRHALVKDIRAALVPLKHATVFAVRRGEPVEFVHVLPERVPLRLHGPRGPRDPVIAVFTGIA